MSTRFRAQAATLGDPVDDVAIGFRSSVFARRLQQLATRGRTTSTTARCCAGGRIGSAGLGQATTSPKGQGLQAGLLILDASNDVLTFTAPRHRDQ